MKVKRDLKPQTSQVQVVSQSKAASMLPIVDEAEADSAVAVVDSSVAAAAVDRRPSTRTKGDKNSEAATEVEAAAELSAEGLVDVVADAAVVVVEVETMKKVAVAVAVTTAAAVAAVSGAHAVHSIAAEAVSAVAGVAADSIKATKKDPANLKGKTNESEVKTTAGVDADAVAVDAVVVVADVEDLVAAPVPRKVAKEEIIKAAAMLRLLLMAQPKGRSEKR